MEEGKKFTEDKEEDKPKTEETPADDDAEDMVCMIKYSLFNWVGIGSETVTMILIGCKFHE